MAEKTGESVCSGSRVVDNQSPVLLSSDGTLNITSSLDAALAPGTGAQNEVKFPDADNLVPNSVTYQASDSRSQLTTQKLYGGAITMQIPGSFQDVSTIREVRQFVEGTSSSVPDHQEVFVDRDSEMSLIVELLSYDEAVSDDQAAAHYYNDLAQCNEADFTSSIECSGKITNETFLPSLRPSSGSRLQSRYVKCGVIGMQKVTKFKKRADSIIEDIIVLLCVVRLHDVDTDLLISLNVPLKSTENRIDLNSIRVPVPSPEGLEDEDVGSSCLGRGCSFLLEGLKADNIMSLTDQPSIGEMLCTEESTNCHNVPQRKESLKLDKTVPGDINSDNTDEILDPTFQNLSKLNMTDIKISDISPDSDIKSDNLCPLEIFRAALNSFNIINWSLFV